MVKTERFIEEMDREWLELMLEAKKIGIAKETVREFLNQNDLTKILIKNS